MPDRLLADEALPWVRPVKAALARRNLARGFRGRWTTTAGVEELPVRNSAPIDVTPQPLLPGAWDVHIAWVFRRVPGADAVAVWTSSVGLNVRGIGLAPQQRTCLVRYDVDHGRPEAALGSLGRHLNVLQPEPLLDTVHFPIPGGDDEWHVPQLLDVLLSPTFFQDLAERL